MHFIAVVAPIVGVNRKSFYFCTLKNFIVNMVHKFIIGTLLLAVLMLLSCSEKAPSKDVLYLNNNLVGENEKHVICDFDGMLAHDSLFSQEYAFCRQQQVEDSDCYFAVFPKENYVGVYDEILAIRLFQHQQYLPSGVDLPAHPAVAYGRLRQQKFISVCGSLQVLLKGDATVTALRLTDNDSIDRLWGNYDVYNIGTEDQELLAQAESEGNNEVWLDCPEGVALSNDTAKVFTVMLPPGALYRGFSMDVFCGDSVLCHVATEKCNTIVRGKIHKMSEIVIR